tara:strand:- start:2022 stop:2642 length:621 start_codon:yes stop_codon:yes gene_type:complete
MDVFNTLQQRVIITDGTSEVAVLTAGADGVSNTQNSLAVSSRLEGFNGTTWDRLRTAGAAQPNLGGLKVVDFHDPAQQADVTNDDSDKTFTVPVDTHWKVYTIAAQFTTTATVGNRLLLLHFRDSSDNILWYGQGRATQAASLTRYYNWSALSLMETAFLNDGIFIGIPPHLWLLPSYDIRIRDVAGIDPAADDLHIRMLVEQRSV